MTERSAPPMQDMFSSYDQERMPVRVYDEQGGYQFKKPMWICPVHGETDLVATIMMPGFPSASFCLPCVLSILEQLGLKPVPRAP